MMRLYQYSVVTVVVLLLVFALAACLEAATIQVSWNANTESDLAGYKVYTGTVSGQYGAPVEVGKETTCLLTISPLQGGNYFFAVTAIDTSGNESGFSPEAACFVPDITAPGAPTGLLIIVRVE